LTHLTAPSERHRDKPPHHQHSRAVPACGTV